MLREILKMAFRTSRGQPAPVPGTLPSNRCQSLLQIGNQVLRVFDADGEANHPLADTHPRPLFGLRWPRLVGQLAVYLRCIPIVDHTARISLDRSACRCCCACEGVGKARSSLSIISTGGLLR